jgi:hypothetical protein
LYYLAYDLFFKGKLPVEVAIALNLREPEAIKLFIEYCKLKRLHKFYLAYKELGDEGIGYFVKLYKLAKKEGYSREQVVKILQLVDENNSYHTLCERKRQELKNINSEASRIVTLVNRFKNNNEEYLKIEKTVEEKVKSVLTDNKQILQFALASIIEALIRNLDKYNNLLVCNASSSSSAIPIQQLPSWHIVGYKDMILDESKELEKLLKHFTNSILDNTVSK